MPGEPTQQIVTRFVTTGSKGSIGALQKMSHAATALGTNFKDLAGKMEEFLRLGPSVKGLRDAFAALGGTSEQLNKLRDATQGSVSDATLMRLSNVARLADINADALDQFAVRALGASDALGISVEEGFERMVNGVAKMEKELLDELGIKVRKLDVVYAEFAANAGKSVKKLTEEEKKLAFQNEVLASSTKIAEIGANAQANAVEQLSAKWENMKTEFTGAVGEFLVANGVFDAMSNALESLGGWFGKNADTMRRIGSQALNLARAVGSHLAYAFETLGPIIADAFEGVGGFLSEHADQINNLIKSGVDLLGKVFTKISDWASENKESLSKVFDFAVKAVESLMAALELLMPLFELIMNGVGLVADGIAWINDEAEKLQKQIWKSSGAADAKAAWDQRMADKQWLLAQMTNASTDSIEKQRQAVKAAANMSEWEKLGIKQEDALGWNDPEMYADVADDMGRHLEEIEKKKTKIREKQKKKKGMDISPALEGFGFGVDFFANEAQAEIEAQESLQAALLDGRIRFLEAKRDAEEWWLTVKENSAKREMEIAEQVAEAERRRNQAIVDGSLGALSIGQDIANAFVKDEKTKAKIAMAMEFARAVGAFALGNYIGGGLHLLSAAKYGIVAGKSAGSAGQAKKKAQKAQDMPRGDMNFGWNSMSKRKSGGAMTQTIVQQFQFGSPGPAGRALADTLNAAVRGSTGVALDQRITRKVGRPGY